MPNNKKKTPYTHIVRKKFLNRPSHKLREDLIEAYNEELGDDNAFVQSRLLFIKEYLQYIEYVLMTDSVDAMRDKDIIRLYCELLNTKTNIFGNHNYQVIHE